MKFGWLPNRRKKEIQMKRWICVLVATVLFWGLSTTALTTSSATQTITIGVEAMAVLSLVGTDGESWTWLVVDDTGIITGSSELRWTTNLNVKVTVQSILITDEQSYVLKVRCVELNSGGTSEGWAIINEEPSDFISGIALEIGGCFLEYEALLKDGKIAGRDEHIITYTIIAQ